MNFTCQDKVLYFTNIAPHYREPLWEKLAEDQELDIEFHFGRPSESGIKEINFDKNVWEKYADKLHRIRNVYLLDRVVWQVGVLKKVLAGKIRKTLFLGDMNIISTWIAALLLRLTGKKVFFWGHGFSGGETNIKKYIRILFNNLAHEHFVYGNRAKDLMREYGFDAETVHVIYNSLDYDKHRQLREVVTGDETLSKIFNGSQLPILVFIGRLTKAKKLDLLIRAVNKLNKDRQICNLLIIGDGEMREPLSEMADTLLSKHSYHFYGSCYNEKEIGKLLANADLCVSPGNVGLTAIHSLSFGTPVCTHDNVVNQMPEHEVIDPGNTGFYFSENDANDLADKIVQWFKTEQSREAIRKKCYHVIDKYYNPYTQIKIFKKVLLS